MLKTIGSALLGLMLSAHVAMAQPCPIGGLTTLTNGTNADATQVMGNFTYVANCVNNFSPPSVPAGTIVAYSGFTLPTGWLWANGATVSRTTYAALWTALSKTDTVTITIASPAVVTWTSGAHGLADDWPVKLFSTGALPTGLVAGQTYFIKAATTSTFRLAAAPGGADINTSGSQSGTQTAVFSPYGIGDNATTFQVPDLRGRVPFGLDNLGGASPASRVTGSGSGIDATTPAASGGSQFLQSHQHALQTRSDLMNGGGATAVYMTGGGSTSTQATGNGNSQNMPPTLITGYIVKY